MVIRLGIVTEIAVSVDRARLQTGKRGRHAMGQPRQHANRDFIRAKEPGHSLLAA
jgi:hypothetical protein